MCLCTQWLVQPPKDSGGKQRYFATEGQASAYAAKYPGATIKPPKQKSRKA